MKTNKISSFFFFHNSEPHHLKVHAILRLPIWPEYIFDQAHSVQTALRTMRCSCPNLFPQNTGEMRTLIDFVVVCVSEGTINGTVTDMTYHDRTVGRVQPSSFPGISLNLVLVGNFLLYLCQHIIVCISYLSLHCAKT